MLIVPSFLSEDNVVYLCAEAKLRRRRDPIYRLPGGGESCLGDRQESLGGSHTRESRCPSAPPVGGDKSGPYDLLAALLTLRLITIGADKSAMGTINRPLQWPDVRLTTTNSST